MKYIFLLLTTSLLLNCNSYSDNKSKTLLGKEIGDTIIGDFNGDGIVESAYVVETKVGKGVPIEDDGIPSEYEVQFSNHNIKRIKIGCCGAILINEGDLYKNGHTVLSVYQDPENGCTHALRTFSLVNGVWKNVIESLVPAGCDGYSDSILRNLVFRRNDSIYCNHLDINDDRWVSTLVLPNSQNVNLDMYQTYCNNKFNFCVYLPDSFVTEKENSEGQIFHDPNKKSEIHVWGKFRDANETLDSSFHQQSKDISLTYQTFKNDWFVFSGVDKTGKIVYSKTAQRKLGNSIIFLTLSVSYPKYENKDFKEYCKAIATSF